MRIRPTWAVPKLIRIATEVGYRLGITTNGEHGQRMLPACAEAGLDRVNFSVFRTTPEELSEVQRSRYRNSKLAGRKIDALRQSIATCEQYGVQASANIVVLDHSHIPRVHRLLDEYSPQLSVRLLNSLDHGTASIEAIERVLAERGATAESDYITAGVSAGGARAAYRLSDGRRVYFKQIRPLRLPDTCAGCRFNNDTDCQEGFYGVRLYYDRDGRYHVGVCIQRMDLCTPLDEFLTRRPARVRIRPTLLGWWSSSMPGMPWAAGQCDCEDRCHAPRGRPLTPAGEAKQLTLLVSFTKGIQ